MYCVDCPVKVILWNCIFHVINHFMCLFYPYFETRVCVNKISRLIEKLGVLPFGKIQVKHPLKSPHLFVLLQASTTAIVLPHLGLGVFFCSRRERMAVDGEVYSDGKPEGKSTCEWICIYLNIIYCPRQIGSWFWLFRWTIRCEDVSDSILQFGTTYWWSLLWNFCKNEKRESESMIKKRRNSEPEKSIRLLSTRMLQERNCTNWKIDDNAFKIGFSFLGKNG